jgi:hypothetical protein
MSTSAITALLLAACSPGSFAVEEQESEWMLAKDQQGVKVYTRKVEGSDFKEFKGIITI